MPPSTITCARPTEPELSVVRENGTPLNYPLVNIWDCKKTLEAINQLLINTGNSHHYDVLLLINGLTCVQIELKTHSISPRRSMKQIVDYKNDHGNDYIRTHRNGLMPPFIPSPDAVAA